MWKPMRIHVCVCVLSWGWGALVRYTAKNVKLNFQYFGSFKKIIIIHSGPEL